MTQDQYQEIASAIFENDWDEKSTIQAGKFSISQFQGTAFDSNYTCYKIHWSDWASTNNVLLAQKVAYSLVAKITESTEVQILKILLERDFPVPKIAAVLRPKDGSVMIFMEMLSGQELYFCTDDDSWINTITSLSLIHSNFWGNKLNNKENIPFSNITKRKLQQAYSNTVQNTRWNAYMNLIFKRFEIAPKTLIHGDMFPTNILVSQRDCKFVDWANAGIAPYMLDVGRLTAIIDKDTFLPMCPCPEKVIRAYFEKMSSLLLMDYNDYLKDIYMAQFVELAYFYSPPGVYGHEKEYNQKIVQRLNEIMESHFKQ